jgi:hypothetical protein
LPPNSPDGSINVASVSVGPADSPTSETQGGNGGPATSYPVTLTGLRPAGGAIPTDSTISWGDGTSEPLGEMPPGGYSLPHNYSAIGAYTITWVYTTDRVHTWRHSIRVSATNTPAPAPQVSTVTAGGTTQFLLSDAISTPWSSWLPDGGGGHFAPALTDPVGFPIDVSQLYGAGANPAGMLTVIGLDGQLVRVPWPTPVSGP